MTVTYELDIFQLILRAGPHILAAANVRHIAPIIDPIIVVRDFGGIVDKTVHTSRSRHCVQVIDLVLAGSVPFRVNFCRPCTAKRHAASQKEPEGGGSKGTKRRGHSKVSQSCGPFLLKLRSKIV